MIGAVVEKEVVLHGLEHAFFIGRELEIVIAPWSVCR